MAVYVRAPYKKVSNLMRHPHFHINHSTDERKVFLPVDFSEDEDEYTLSAAIPGLNPDQVEIEIKDRRVSLKGEFSSENEETDKTYHLRERTFGKFARSFNLPDMVDASKAEAKMENGVLTLSIPKAEEAKPKTIKVTAK